MKITKFTDKDAPDIAAVVQSCFARVARTKAKLPISYNACLSYITRQAQLGNAFLVSGYLVVVEPQVPYFSTSMVLVEMCVVRYKEEQVACISDVPKFLLAEAKRRGLRFVVAGDSLSGVMTKVYLSTPGYEPLGQTVAGDLACVGD